MGQRAALAPKSLSLSVFRTDVGWVGLAGAGQSVTALVFGYDSQAEVLGRCSALLEEGAELGDWNPVLRKRLEQFLDGNGDSDFRDVETVETEGTRFAAAVIRAVREIPAGEVLTYAEVASRAGSPKASRAVGNIMARNSIPLIIPCHRVVGSDGRLGGFSSPQGISMKSRLLAMEAEALNQSGTACQPRTGTSSKPSTTRTRSATTSSKQSAPSSRRFARKPASRTSAR